MTTDPESLRIRQRDDREADWDRWGCYLSDRQWGTVREDYSAGGDAWGSFPFEHAGLRAYRWGEDGLLGWADRKCRLCFSFAFWNHRDPILKERLFGLTNSEGNHGEDVKELYFFLSGTPTFSYQRALYIYPREEFPYEHLKEGNARRERIEPELELHDTGIFESGYFEMAITYAKASPEDMLLCLNVTNCSGEQAPLTILPTLWYRNTWSWGRISQEVRLRPSLAWEGDRIVGHHETLGACQLFGPPGAIPVFTENETNTWALYGIEPATPHTKDAIQRYVVAGESGAVNPEPRGTKAAFVLAEHFAPGETKQFDLRLQTGDTESGGPFGPSFDEVLTCREAEARQFWDLRLGLEGGEERQVAGQAMAGLLWSRKFYYYCVPEWIEGDPAQPRPPGGRERIRNGSWTNVYARDTLLMPDGWEYPWFAAWDLAFHAVALAPADPAVAKHQILLLCREWYMKNNGQLPAYEWEFSDVNPPVQAWAAWRVYRIEEELSGEGEYLFLERVFQKLLLNFTWWVNRKDSEGHNLFSGGFLGLDNIGVFDRSKGLPGGGRLEQADGTAWVGVYCLYMLQIAIELSRKNPAYEDMASKFFEHFIEIIDAMNAVGGGLWDEEHGFYFDRLLVGHESIPMRIRSLVGIIPLLAAGELSSRTTASMSGFRRRFEWFLENRPELAAHIETRASLAENVKVERFLSLVPRDRLERILQRLFDEEEFLSDFGIRSLSKAHLADPFVLECGHGTSSVTYLPGESDNALFGGNSNWRGPIWMPLNFMIVDALRRFHRFYGSGLRVEVPRGSGERVTLDEAADLLSRRLMRIFIPDESGERPCLGSLNPLARRENWGDRILFHEYFHGDSGEGLGASHQTGWTALIAQLAGRAMRADNSHPTPEG